jgi:hypothetical protein
MSFAAPMVRMEQNNHLSNCYFCSTKTDGHKSKSKHTIVYPTVPSALRPVEHDDSLLIPKPPQQQTLHEEPTSTSPVDEPELPNNMDLPFRAVSYSKNGWKICGDLKVVELLLGMQSGYTKFSCFLCEWDS